jgi:hypothetical protein
MRSATESFLIPRSFLTVRRHNTDPLSIQFFKRGHPFWAVSSQTGLMPRPTRRRLNGHQSLLGSRGSHMLIMRSTFSAEMREFCHIAHPKPCAGSHSAEATVSVWRGVLKGTVGAGAESAGSRSAARRWKEFRNRTRTIWRPMARRDRDDPRLAPSSDCLVRYF